MCSRYKTGNKLLDKNSICKMYLTWKCYRYKMLSDTKMLNYIFTFGLDKKFEKASQKPVDTGNSCRLLPH